MPIYEYRCKECHQVFENWCKHIEDGKETTTCPICKGLAERMISHTSFALKGGGWYVTEYGNRKGKEESPPNGKNSSENSAAASATPAPATTAAPASPPAASS